jgi:hypothetical protein
MESPPTGPGRTLIITRAGAIGVALGLMCMSFIAGWLVSRADAMRMVKASIAIVETQHADEVKGLRERASVPYFDYDGPDDQPVDQDLALRNFEPSPDDSVTLSQTGGMGGIDRHIKVSADGSITISDGSGTRQATILSKASCRDFFRKVLASRLACYSEEVVELKRDLAYPGTMHNVTCAVTTRFRILIPELKVDREFSIYVPEVQLKNYPDIIEYRSAAEIEKEIHSFVP